jgi:hypothetical protein
LEVDYTGAHFLRTDLYVSMVTPINLGQFDDFLEEHISSRLVPTAYVGNFNPLNKDFWLLLHNHPLAEQNHTFAAIIYPETDSEPVLTEGVRLALERKFNLPADSYPGCIECFCMFLHAYLARRLTS